MKIFGKEPDKNSATYRAGQVLGVVITSCLTLIVAAATFKLIESWF